MAGFSETQLLAALASTPREAAGIGYSGEHRLKLPPRGSTRASLNRPSLLAGQATTPREAASMGYTGEHQLQLPPRGSTRASLVRETQIAAQASTPREAAGIGKSSIPEAARAISPREVVSRNTPGDTDEVGTLVDIVA